MPARELLHAFGLLKSVNLQVFKPEDPAEICSPVVNIYSKTTTLLCSKDVWSNVRQVPPSNSLQSFNVPLETLGSMQLCEEWIKGILLSMKIVAVASEAGNSKKQLVEMIWKLKERSETGEMCVGVVEMKVVKVVQRLMEFKRRVVDKWLKVRVKSFKRETGNCCVICLEDLDENSAVVKLLCRHAFHSKCIGEWLIRETHCPLAGVGFNEI